MYLRRVWVFTTDDTGAQVTKRAKFHKWVQVADVLFKNGAPFQFSYAAAIVEYDDGMVDTVGVDQLQFLNSKTMV